MLSSSVVFSICRAAMNAEQRKTTEFFLESWLNEAVNRCNAFLHNVSKPHNNFYKTRMFEEHYILTATVMSVRFARQLVNHASKDLKNELQQFIEATRDAVDVRDMREHSDEYFLGKGRKKGEFYKGSKKGIQCDMSSSINNERGYMLGNLIAMELIREECQNLLSHIRENI